MSSSAEPGPAGQDNLGREPAEVAGWVPYLPVIVDRNPQGFGMPQLGVAGVAGWVPRLPVIVGQSPRGFGMFQLAVAGVVGVARRLARSGGSCSLNS